MSCRPRPDAWLKGPLRAAVWGAVGVCFIFPPAAADEPAVSPASSRPEKICGPGTVIGSITVERINVFDTSLPEQRCRGCRLVNLLHRPMLSREWAIRRMLTIHVGEACDPARLTEAARVLRQQTFLQDAWVEPVSSIDGKVVVKVRVRDAWSTRLRLSFSSAGGTTQRKFKIYEENPLGTGSSLGWELNKDQDRTQRLLRFSAPALLGRGLQFGLTNSDNSDGIERSFHLGRPFFALDNRQSFDISANREEREEKVYEGPEPIDRYRLEGRSTGFALGWAPGGLHGDRVTRWTFGLLQQRRRWTLSGSKPAPARPEWRPVDFDWRLLQFGLEWQRVSFREERFLNRAHRVEDFDLSTRLSANLDLALPSLSPETGGRLRIEFHHGIEIDSGDYLVLEAHHTLNRKAERWFGALTEITARWFRRVAERQSQMAALTIGRGRRLEGHERYLLGGDTGLRGYRSRAFTGDNLVLAQWEQRWFGSKEWLQIFQPGVVGFVEAGGAFDGRLDLGKLHPDIGLGFRLAILRSAHGTTLHFNLAFPLDPNGDPDGKSWRYSFLTLSSF